MPSASCCSQSARVPTASRKIAGSVGAHVYSFSMPRSRSFFAVTGPTPHSASTGSFCRNGSTRSGAITVSPSGFFHPDAIFARNLFGATPADAVSPVAARISSFRRRATIQAERFAPGVLGDVEVGLVERQRLDERRHRAENFEHRLRCRLVSREVGAHDHAATGTGAPRATSGWPSAHRTRALRSSPPPPRRDVRAIRRRRQEVRAARADRAVRPTHRMRPYRREGCAACRMPRLARTRRGTGDRDQGSWGSRPGT